MDSVSIFQFCVSDMTTMKFQPKRLAQKFALIGVLISIPIIFATTMLFRSMSEGILFAESELQGMDYHRGLRFVMESMQAHRSAALTLSLGDRASVSTMEQRAADVEKRLQELEAIDASGLGAQFKSTDKLRALKTQWSSVRTQSGSATVDDVAKAHADLIANVIGMMDYISAESLMILDPDADSLYMLLTLTSQVPGLSENNGHLRVAGDTALAAGKLSVEQRERLSVLSGKLTTWREQIAASGVAAFGANPELKTKLEADFNRLGSDVDAFLAAVAADVVRPATPTMTIAAFNEKANRVRDSAYALYDASFEPTKDILYRRIDGFTTKKWMVVGFVMACVLAAAFIAVMIIRGITRGAKQAAEAAEAVSRGDLQAAIPEGSGDEIGAILTAMRGMKGTIERIVAAQSEMATKHDQGQISFMADHAQFQGAYGEMTRRSNELVQAHIDVNFKLVDVMQHYARGDLSVDMPDLPGEKAKVTHAAKQAKANLLAINGEIKRLVDAASRGDFTVRGEAEKYEGAYREMVEGLNKLMATANGGLEEIIRVLGALSQGDLTEKMVNQYDGVFDQLKNDSSMTVQNLTEIITRIKEAVDAINTAAKEIAAGNSDLSARTETQASSLEETASSMEELTSTVKQNAENARQANQLAIGASEVASKGGQVVAEVVKTMSDINQSSKKIAEIITVIDGIAFQTNILALNAAVEAARAGEQGRGFAVVATEVRNLAQRSAAAAKEIKALISDSVERVGVGTKLVDDAGQTMEEIVTSVRRVTDIMAEITAASQEQSSGIEQVNQAIAQMDEVTQQNAALVEEAAAAAESLEEQAHSLTESVATFKLSRSEVGAAAMVERRGPNRAQNVSRLPAAKPVVEAPKAQKSAASAVRSKVVGGKDAEDEWEEF